MSEEKPLEPSRPEWNAPNARWWHELLDDDAFEELVGRALCGDPEAIARIVIQSRVARRKARE